MGVRRQPDGMSAANLQRHHPRRGLLCNLYMEKFTTCFGVRVKTFSAHVMTVSRLVVRGKRFKLHEILVLTICLEKVDIVKRVGRPCGGTTPARARWLWSVNH